MQTLLLSGALLASGCKEKPKPETSLPVVSTQPVAQVALSAARQRYAATLAPYTQTNLNFENSAYVERIMMVPRNGSTVLVDAGDTLREGEVLARQDASEFEAKAAQAKASVKQAQAGVAESQSKLQQAMASLTQAQENYSAAIDKAMQARAARRQAVAGLAKATAQREETRKAFERATVLYHEEAQTKPEYDRDLANYEKALADVAGARAQIAQTTEEIAAADAQARTAKAQITSAEAQVSAAQQGVDAAQAQLEGAKANQARADIALGHCTLRMPTDGVLVQRNVAPGSLVGPGSTAFVVADLSRMKAVFGVPDTEVDHLKVGTDVKMVMDAFPGTLFKGRVSSISPSADSKGRVFDVAVMIDNPERRLKNGMIAKIELESAGPKRDAIVVPLTALMRSPTNMDAYAVMVVADENGKTVAHIRDVKLGRTTGNLVEVTQGLDIKDRIVVGGSNLVPDGAAVTVQ
ncbi:MAG: efflux RND transporter periplasmic adaptor subunit [Proteobacteria bacterium]|nr:efflux RND transporter periplasmic adaptor subunit [Pseudomonadota bacterium]